MAVVANLDAILGAKVDTFERGISGAIVTSSELQKQLREAGLTQREWNRIVKEGASVTAQMRSPLEIYEQEVRDLNRLLKTGQISQQTFDRALVKTQATLRNASPVHREHNRLLAEGAAVTAAVRTPLEIYQLELVKLNRLLNAGAISQQTFNRSILAGQASLQAGAAKTQTAFAGIASTVKGLAITYAGFKAITGVSDLAARAIAQEERLTQSTAIIGGLNDELRKKLIDNALAVSRETKFSVEELNEAYFFLFSAGLDVNQSITALPQVARFAQAGAFDLAIATDLATDAQSALGLVSGDTAENLVNLTRVTDTLIGANTLANATAQQFSEALTNKAGAALRALGKDIEEGAAVLAVFADQGVKGADGGTQLAIVLRDLQTKAIKFADQFEDAGIRVFDSAGNFRNMGEVIADVENTLEGLSDQAQKTKLLDLGFSDKSVSAIQTLLGTSDEIREKEDALRALGGIAKDVAENQFTDLSRAANNLEGSIDELTSKNETFLKSLATLTQFMADSVDVFNSFDRALKLAAADDVQSHFETIANFLEVVPFRSWLGVTDKDVENMRSIADSGKKISEAGTSNNPVANIQQQQDTQELDRQLREIETRAARVANSIKTPFENLVDQAREFKELLDLGAISGRTYERALDKELEKFRATQEETAQLIQSSRANVLDSIGADSEEAFELIFGTRGKDESLALQKDENKLHEKELEIMKRIETAIKEQDRQPAGPPIELNTVNW